MNKSRINRAIGHIDELIALCEQDRLDKYRVQTARESLDYLRFIIESYVKSVEDIEDAADRASTLHGSLSRISWDIDRESPNAPVSLGP